MPLTQAGGENKTEAGFKLYTRPAVWLETLVKIEI